MRMNTWAWVALGAGLAGVLVGVASVIASVPGGDAVFIATGMLAVFGGMAFLFYRLFFAPMINISRLQKKGIPGKATVLAVKDTNVTINNNPQVKLTLEVKDNLGQKYTTTTKVLVSRINPFAYQPGTEVPVRIDPNNDRNVVIDFTGANDSADMNQQTTTVNSQDTTLLQTNIQAVDAENQSILFSGVPARAIVKKNTWLGIYVNGNNPYVELELEILPETAPAFGGKARGVISEAAVSKFQPGCEIHVKYDRYDNSRVAVDHS